MSQKSSILAGIFIGMGGLAYLSLSCKELGAALFALGLLAVLIQGYSLFTGKVGYITTVKEVPTLIFMCLRNFAGAAAIGIISSLIVYDSAVISATEKLSHPLYITFVSSVLCGFLVYIAVELFLKERHPLLVIMPIMAFILCKLDHCVANVFTLSAARIFTIDSIIFILICTIGNGIGALLIHILEKFKA